MTSAAPTTRRGVLAGGGLLVAFTLAQRALGQGGDTAAAGGNPPKVVEPTLEGGSLGKTPLLDAWIRIGPDGRVEVFTGKAELGQGIRTALTQLAAEELDLPPGGIHLVTPDTTLTPDEGYTAGSHSMQDSGSAIANAAANVRVLLADEAAKGWDLAPEAIATTGDGHMRAPDGRTAGYGELAARLSLHVAAKPGAPRRSSRRAAQLGPGLPRVDIPGKLTGGQAYVHDLRLPGMLHARVVRGPAYGTVLNPASDTTLVGGRVRVVRSGRFTAVVGQREWDVITALRQLQALGWRRSGGPPPSGPAADVVRSLPSQDKVVFDQRGAAGPPARTVNARYSRPWLLHGSIGPSCAVAQFEDGVLTVWSHTQGVFPLRKALSELMRLPLEKVRCIHAEGAGCYGHNGADDVAADAALVARAMPGRPIRLQWMREQEHGWEPFGPGMATELEAGLDADGRIVAWRHEVWSNTHNSRPGTAGSFLAGAEVEPPFPPPEPKPMPLPEGGGDRNIVPLYAIPTIKAVEHFLPKGPARTSALRSLGAHANVFSIEGFMDELAAAAAADPVAFRLNHLDDPRAREVVSRAAAHFGWDRRAKGDGRRGSGFAFARYKNQGAFCAVAMAVEVERETGAVTIHRVHAAVDAGQAVNPDGIRNQVEGAIVQSLSWTGHEAVNFAPSGLTSFDWSAYPILRFADAPLSVTVEIVNRPGAPFLGVGEAGQGPAAAALANAVADATGARLRDMPLTAERIKAAIGV